MRILLANPRGFCAGVNMAITTVEEALKIVGTPLYVYHEIVHNRHVVERFVRQGVIFVDAMDEVPPRATVIFSAHGVSPEVRRLARERGCTMIDATCPLVTKVHLEAMRYARQGYRVLLVGHAGHDEVVGTVGEAPDAIAIVESVRDVAGLKYGPEEKLVFLTQTTLSRDDAEAIIIAIRAKFPQVKSPPSEDICYATTNRQMAVRQLAEEAQMVLVVGSRNSSNSLRLTEIARNRGRTAHLVDDLTELDYRWFEGVETALVTAGASAPEDLVEGIVADLQKHFGGTVEEVRVIDEDMRFELPVSLRVLRPRAEKT